MKPENHDAQYCSVTKCANNICKTFQPIPAPPPPLVKAAKKVSLPILISVTILYSAPSRYCPHSFSVSLFQLSSLCCWCEWAWLLQIWKQFGCTSRRRGKERERRRRRRGRGGEKVEPGKDIELKKEDPAGGWRELRRGGRFCWKRLKPSCVVSPNQNSYFLPLLSKYWQQCDLVDGCQVFVQF